MEMIEKRNWKEFREAGLIWFINRLIHLFGWAIVLEVSQDDPSEIISVYPA